MADPVNQGIGAGLGGAALGAIPVIGSIGSAMLQQHYARKNWDRANAYNHPKEQIKRLREAGLPLASMFGGSGGSTTSAQETPNIDPSLGTARGIENYMQTGMMRKQIELLDSQIENTEAETNKTNIDANRSGILGGIDSLNLNFLKGLGGSDTTINDTMNNFERGVVRERQIKEAERVSKEVANKLDYIKLDVQQELHRMGKLTEETIRRIENTIANTDSVRIGIQNALKTGKILDQNLIEGKHRITNLQEDTRLKRQQFSKNIQEMSESESRTNLNRQTLEYNKVVRAFTQAFVDRMQEGGLTNFEILMSQLWNTFFGSK